jgi:hypothetical protein
MGLNRYFRAAARGIKVVAAHVLLKWNEPTDPWRHPRNWKRGDTPGGTRGPDNGKAAARIAHAVLRTQGEDGKDGTKNDSRTTNLMSPHVIPRSRGQNMKINVHADQRMTVCC